MPKSIIGEEFLFRGFLFKGLEKSLTSTSYNVENGYGYSHSILIDNFIESIEKGLQPYVTAKSSIATHEAIHSLYRSSEQHSKWCRISSKEESLKLGL